MSIWTEFRSALSSTASPTSESKGVLGVLSPASPPRAGSISRLEPRLNGLFPISTLLSSLPRALPGVEGVEEVCERRPGEPSVGRSRLVENSELSSS